MVSAAPLATLLLATLGMLMLAVITTSHDVPQISELSERPQFGRGEKRVFNLLPLNFQLLLSSLECNAKLIFL